MRAHSLALLCRIVASTLLVTAQSQIVGRLIQIITTQMQLQQVGTYSRLDPISGEVVHASLHALLGKVY